MFDFKTLKDNTFCIYDVKEGQADKIKVIMGELGIGDYHNWDKETYYVADNDIGELQANRRIIFDMNRKNTKETYRKTATEFLEEYGEWKGESKMPTAKERVKNIIMVDNPYRTSSFWQAEPMTEEDLKKEIELIKPNIIKKTMNTIKKVLRSKEDKALAHFVLGTSKELRSSGKEEFLDFIYETGKTDKVEFLKKIVEAYEEDKK